MRKFLYILAIIVIATIVHGFTTQAAPTSTIVQNLIIKDLSDATNPYLIIGTNGLVATSTAGGGTVVFLANGMAFLTTSTINFQAGANVTITTSTDGTYTITGAAGGSGTVSTSTPFTTGDLVIASSDGVIETTSTVIIGLSDISEDATGLDYNSGTGVFSLTSGYFIPLTASGTQWDSAFQSSTYITSLLASSSYTGALLASSSYIGSFISSSTYWDTAYLYVNASSSNWDKAFQSSTYISPLLASSSFTGPLLASSTYISPLLASSTYIASLLASSTLWDTIYYYVNGSSSNWDTAYSWGDHSLAGYLTAAFQDAATTTAAGTFTVATTTSKITITIPPANDEYFAPSSTIPSIITNLTDVSSTAAVKNNYLIFNGTQWVAAPLNTTFTFSCTAFDDGISTGILAGSGVYKATSSISFTATYNNGPPTTADIKMSINGGTYNTYGSMSAPSYTTGTNAQAVVYPTVDQYVRFRLDSDDGTDYDIDYAASLYFYNYIYYGPSTTGSSFAEADVEALTGTISPSYTTSRTINSGASQYVVWAYPSRYTSINALGAKFNSVTMPFTAPETVALTNSAGLTENYKVFASTGTNLGNSTLSLSTAATTIDPLYYGTSTTVSGYAEADVEGLKYSTVTNDNTQVWSSVTANAGEYLLFAFPLRLGIPTFQVGGFDGGFESPETVSVTNVNGYSENYYVWRSTNSGLGATVVTTY